MQEQNMEIEESLCFTCLPDHIWEKTFSYSGNLKNLMLSCKYFNDLIMKSRQCMAKMKLVLEDSKSKDQDNIAAIIKSERKISRVYVRNVRVLDRIFLEILDHFKEHIKKIKFESRIKLSSVVLVDLLKTMHSLEKLYFRAYATLTDRHSISIASESMINSVVLPDLKFLQFMPEIKNLEVTSRFNRDSHYLKSYLANHKLTHLSIEFRKNAGFPALALDNINIELISLKIETYSESKFNNHAIRFIKSQAKSLKSLEISGFSFNFNIIQQLLESVIGLQILELRGEMEDQTTEFVGRNFKCPKLEELRLHMEPFEYPGFFEKFPNLKILRIYSATSASLVNSVVRNCRKIGEIYTDQFNADFENATFPELKKLLISRLNDRSEPILEDFLSRHQKLSYLNFSFEVEPDLFRKLPVLAPNLNEIRFNPFKGFVEADLRKLLLLCKNIEKIIIAKNLREFDLNAVTIDLPRTKNSMIIFRGD
jgi:hypothetical protein